MSYNICIIDDDFPTKVNEVTYLCLDDTKLLNSSNLKLLLNKVEDWHDPNLKNLIEELFKDEKNWNISAFKSPEIFLNHIENEVFAPEVLIFDWDYPIKNIDSESHLLEILKTNYCIIKIYSGADKDKEIEEVLKKKEFLPFKERVDSLSKKIEDSVKQLLNEVIKKVNQIFHSNLEKNYVNNLQMQ